ncbi:transposase domain-containing protein [Rhizophagus clarus]|uniref:Transposase domain-containing protein n=1 Tax=Rhizophagus clarus TaxID=94130 RepID=A0A8H3R1K5_9GLOM|nr:transposase domain-containing protein [Rhizophagus clarus]
MINFLDSMIISDELLEGLRLLYVKSNFNFSKAAFNNIYKVFNRNKMSFNKIKKILGSIVGIEPKIYDMCVNLCCAFVGVLENERKCKFCKEDRYYSNGKSRKNLPFISIIECLKLQFKNSKRSEELLYRYNYTNNIGDFVYGDIGDIFDGQIYKELLDDGYFPNPRYIAFTASCDRPKQPQDFNSFFYPLIQEMKMLQDGISCYDGNKKENFTLRAHILAWTGDLPALSKVLYLTGHNSYSGCRFCNLQGTLNETNKHPETPILECINNASSIPDLALAQEMDMDISSPASHQSTSAQPHTTAVNSTIVTTPKGKGKKKKHKHLTISEEDIDKDFRLPVDSVDESIQALSSQLPPPPLHDANKKVEESSAPLLYSNADKEKRLIVQDDEAAQVITGYQAPSGCQFVRDILIYDVPAKWDNYELLSHLST